MKRRIVLAVAIVATLTVPLMVAALSSSPLPHSPIARSPRPDLAAPPAWTGQWDFRVEYYGDRGNLFAVDESAVAICPGDRLGLESILPAEASQRWWRKTRDPRRHGTVSEHITDVGCEGGSSDDRLALACEARVTLPGCQLDLRLDAIVEPAGDGRLEGTSEWRLAASSGACGPILAHFGTPGETARLSGTRTNEDPGPCMDPPRSLIERVTRHAGIARATLPAIRDLTARTAGPTVHLAWPAREGAVAYDILRASVDGPFTWVGRSAASKQGRFMDRPPAHPAGYRYVVRWIDDEGRESPVSNDVLATPGGAKSGSKGGAR